MHRYSEAAVYAANAVEIAQRTFTQGHPRMAMYEECLTRISQQLTR